MSNDPARLFEELVGLNYQLYSSLFLKLPLDAIEQTGTLLPLLSEACATGCQKAGPRLKLLRSSLNSIAIISPSGNRYSFCSRSFSTSSARSY